MEQKYASSRRTSALQHVRMSSPHATSRTPSLIFKKDTCACSRTTSTSHSTPGMRPSSFVQPSTWSFQANVKDTKDDEGPPWQLVKNNKKNKKMHINQNTHVKEINSPNITKRNGDHLQKINKCGMHTCG